MKRPALAITACLLAACAAPPKVAPLAKASPGVTLTGSVLLPSKLLANNGGNIIAAGGANLVAAGGANITAAGGGNIISNNGGSYRLASTTDAPLAGATVMLVDRNRKPIPGLAPAVTDAQGHYTLKGVPAGLTALVVAGATTQDGKDAHLEALAFSDAAGADLGLASTMISVATPATVQPDPAALKEASSLTAAALKDDALPDLADRHGLVKKLDRLAELSPALAAALSKVRGVVPTPAPGTIETVLPVANPAGFAIGADGAFYFAAANTLVRATADGEAKTLASLAGAVGGVRGIALGADGEVLVGDGAGSRIMKLVGDAFEVAAGTTPGFGGDGGPWKDAQFQSPRRIAADGAGGFLVADGTRRVRQLRKDGTVATIAGDGTAGQLTGTMGDGGPATAAQLAAPTGLVVLGGEIFIADPTAQRVRRVKADGTIATFAGTGQAGSSGDGGPATAAMLNGPTDLATDGTSLFILEASPARIRKVDAAGTITTYAGTGDGDTATGDDGPATAAVLGEVRGIAVDPQGHLCILGTEAIRRVR